MNAKRTALLAWLDQYPEGLSWSEISDWHGGSHAAVHALLRRMSNSWLIAFSGSSSCHGTWHTPRHAETARAAYMQDRALRVEMTRQKRHLYDKGRQHAKAESRRKARELAGVTKPRMPKQSSSEAAAMSWAEKAPVHRIVNASEAAPLQKTGPATVWDLAA